MPLVFVVCVYNWPSRLASHEPPQRWVPCILNNFLHTTRQGWHTAEIIQITQVSNGFRSAVPFQSKYIFFRHSYEYRWPTGLSVSLGILGSDQLLHNCKLPWNLPGLPTCESALFLPTLPSLPFCVICNAYTYTGSVVNIGSDKWLNKFKIQGKITFKGIPWEIVFFMTKMKKIIFAVVDRFWVGRRQL